MAVNGRRQTFLPSSFASTSTVTILTAEYSSEAASLSRWDIGHSLMGEQEDTFTFPRNKQVRVVSYVDPSRKNWCGGWANPPCVQLEVVQKRHERLHKRSYSLADVCRTLTEKWGKRSRSTPLTKLRCRSSGKGIL